MFALRCSGYHDRSVQAFISASDALVRISRQILLGGAMTMFARLVAAPFLPVIGGPFLAFPASFGKRYTNRKASQGAQGASRFLGSPAQQGSGGGRCSARDARKFRPRSFRPCDLLPIVAVRRPRSSLLGALGCRRDRGMVGASTAVKEQTAAMQISWRASAGYPPNNNPNNDRGFARFTE